MDFLGSGLVVRHARAPVGARAESEPAPGAPPKTTTGDINLSNILKLVPGDVVAVYLAGKGLSGIGDISGYKWPVVLFWLCLIVCVLLRVLVTMKSPGGVNWILVIVTTVAFFVWAHAVNDIGPVIPTFNGSGAGIVAMLLGLIAPLLVPAQPE